MMSLSNTSQPKSQNVHCKPELSQVYKVGLAELKTVNSRGVLTTSLGSCIAICLHDPIEKIGGMAHVMLPHRTNSRTMRYQPGRYADTATKALIHDMVKKGSEKKNIVAKITGGARMSDYNGISNIGDRNAEATKETLEKEGIRLVGEDTGGSFGRVVDFYTNSGRVGVRKIMNKNESIFF